MADELHPDDAKFIMDVRKKTSDLVIQRMLDFPVQFNIRSPVEVRRAALHYFDSNNCPLPIYSWSTLCLELPEAPRILSLCILDPRLSKLLDDAYPTEPDKYTLLPDEQKVALVMIVAGYNLFLTGCAGTGKSMMITSARLTLNAVLPQFKRGMAICASSGVAACNINGVTVHSTFALNNKNPAQYGRRLCEHMEGTALVLIDEVSMTSVQDFYRVHMRICDALATLNDPTMLQYAGLPFGGRQVVLSGDFSQLGDVQRKPTGHDAERIAQNQHAVEVAEFRTLAPEYAMFSKWRRVFRSPLWWQTMTTVCCLRKVMRQNDPSYVTFLHGIRTGMLHQLDAIRFVREHMRNECDIPENTMFLYSTNDEADARNAYKMSALSGPDIIYSMVQRSANGEVHDGTLEKHRYQITLRMGARVRLTRNLSVALNMVNGSQCEFAGLVPIMKASRTLTPHHKGDDERARPASDTKTCHIAYPVTDDILHYYAPSLLPEGFFSGATLMDGGGFTLRKTGNSMGIELCMASSSNVFCKESIHPLSTSPRDSSVHRYHCAEAATRGKNFDYEEYSQNALRQFCCAVRFYDKPAHEIYVLPPVMWTREEHANGNPVPLNTQVQVPLVPAYASTVHASQGLSLNSVAIDLGAKAGTMMRDPALLYVALSRAVSASSVHFLRTPCLYTEPDRLVTAFHKRFELER